MAQTYSGSQALPLGQKLREWVALSRMAACGSADTTAIFRDLDEYDELLRKYADITLPSSRVMEFGFGARPLRQIALGHLAVRAAGVDRDRPEGNGGLASYWMVYQENGLERMVKTAARRALAGNRQRNALERELEKRTGRPVPSKLDLIIADLSDADALRDIPAESYDVIISEDVFEHIPAAGLTVATSHAARLLAQDGLALIRPNVFTGITGGHLTEWYHDQVDHGRKRSEPWEHLRKRRFKANTFLNELTRAQFRSIFEEHFEIIDEIVKIPNLGKHYATPSVRAELSQYTDEELFSNQVMWVLRKK